MSLSKSMTISQGIVLAVCTLIGSGLLGLPGLAIEAVGGQAAALAWPLTMLMSLPLVIIFLTLSLNVQDSGGVARYVGMVFGPRAESATTFILALTFMLCIPLGTYMGAAYIQTIFMLPETSRFWIAALILMITTLVNALGVKPASWINNASALSLIALVVLFVLSRPDLVSAGISGYKHYIYNWKDVKFSGLWAASALLFWAFLGWENLSFGSEELKGGRKAIITIFVASFVIVSSIYGVLAIVATGAYNVGMPVASVSGLLSILDDGPFATLSHILIVLIVIANVNAWVFAASRLMYSAGRARLLPSYLGHLSSPRSLPRAALLSMLIIYLILVAAVSFNIIPLATGLILANQNFIIIYAVVIICYAKSSSGLFSWVIVIMASLSSVFLIAGFKGLLIIPLLLGIIGYIVAARRKQV